MEALKARLEAVRDGISRQSTLIKAIDYKRRVTTVFKTGWHDVGGQSVFVLPEITIGPRGAETVILDGAAHGLYEARGTLKDWQNPDGVGALASGHALPDLAISAALEDGLKLDLNQLIRAGVARPGSICRASIRWTVVYSGDERAAGIITAHMTGESYGWLELEVERRRQEIALESKPRHFGGRQWYFVCPTRHCLVSILWRANGASTFASRKALVLASGRA